jgi:hypothetical protein
VAGVEGGSGSAPDAALADLLGRLNAKLALVVGWTELLAGTLAAGEERELAERARRAAWAAAALADEVRRRLRAAENRRPGGIAAGRDAGRGTQEPGDAAVG